MSKIQPSIIKEIAREITQGNTCYIHKQSTKLTTIDNTSEGKEIAASQEKRQSEIDRKIDDYIKIEKLSTENLLIIMSYFSEELQDKSVIKQLSNALKRKNPVRNFNQVIDSDMELIQHWRNFSFAEHQRWVSNFINDAYHY